MKKIEISKEYLEEEYLNKNRSLNEIAKDFNCSRNVIWRRVKEFNLIKDKSMRQISNIKDQKFGRLIAKEFVCIKGRNAHWKCLCDCGKTVITTSSRLRIGTASSCGCYRDEQRYNATYKGGKYISGNEFSSYKTNANKRKFKFIITVQDIENQYEKQNKKCRFTGEKLIFNTTHNNGKNGKIIRGNASIDRIDSKKGYTPDNIQIVHKDINIAKSDKSDEEFIEMCRKIIDYEDNK